MAYTVLEYVTETYKEERHAHLLMANVLALLGTKKHNKNILERAKKLYEDYLDQYATIVENNYKEF